MKGSTYKRCRCRGDGRDLGNACPQLRRADGSWNPNHGSWFYRVELEPDADGHRRILPRGGFPSQKAALAALDEAGGQLIPKQATGPASPSVVVTIQVPGGQVRVTEGARA